MINTGIYLGLGSNLGSRKTNIFQALRKIAVVGSITALSYLYETRPVGFNFQPYYYNAVCQLSTELTVFELLHTLKTIEKKAGRARTFPNAPRTLDLDILLYGNMAMVSPTLTVPHPRMAERGFVLVPLNEIAPTVTHPVSGLSVSEQLKVLRPQNISYKEAIPSDSVTWRLAP